MQPGQDHIKYKVMLKPGGYKEMSSILADQKRPRMSPNAGGGGELRGSQPLSTVYTGAQMNFEDLTPYLTYDGDAVVELHIFIAQLSEIN